ncbi:hypothetical protein, partial [endosymbiont of Lamellibrachia barhami]|uniref:hypothetical protein n=1 Tax=endosymbiont of Lamellibrachia barhami TaxID=205975 RepID=UPI001C4BCD87
GGSDTSTAESTMPSFTTQPSRVLPGRSAMKPGMTALRSDSTHFQLARLAGPGKVSRRRSTSLDPEPSSETTGSGKNAFDPAPRRGYRW